MAMTSLESEAKAVIVASARNAVRRFFIKSG
jgi:hypothetical protein